MLVISLAVYSKCTTTYIFLEVKNIEHLRTLSGWFHLKYPIYKNPISLNPENGCSCMWVFTVFTGWTHDLQLHSYSIWITVWVLKLVRKDKGIACINNILLHFIKNNVHTFWQLIIKDPGIIPILTETKRFPWSKKTKTIT